MQREAIIVGARGEEGQGAVALERECAKVCV